MTRILIYSDTHFEFDRTGCSLTPDMIPSPDTYDVIVAAGDIGIGVDGIDRFADLFPIDKPIIFVPGNHEYYRGNFNDVNQEFEYGDFELRNIHILNPGVEIFEDIVFIGATLWTDFNLEGYPNCQNQASMINDFRLIRDFSPQTAAARFEVENRFIREQVEAHRKNGSKKIVVVTHFVPTQKAIHPRFGKSFVNPYFTNDMDDIFPSINCWIFGHTHDRYLFDVYGPGDGDSRTIIAANPKGYPRENPDRYEGLIIDL